MPPQLNDTTELDGANFWLTQYLATNGNFSIAYEVRLLCSHMHC